MDSESPVAFSIAGQAHIDAGTSFTSNARTVKSEFGFDRDGDGVRGRRLGSHPHRRRADGDGL